MNTYLTPQERLDLKRLIHTHNCDDNTEHIRRVKHSSLIQKDIMALVQFLRSSAGADADEQEAQTVAPFLYANYTDIFRRVLRHEINYDILSKVLNVLRAIENEEVDQHEGSVLVGKVLKEFYVDSAIRHGDNLDKKYAASQPPKPEVVPEKKISWKEFKQTTTAAAAAAATTS